MTFEAYDRPLQLSALVPVLGRPQDPSSKSSAAPLRAGQNSPRGTSAPAGPPPLVPPGSAAEVTTRPAAPSLAAAQVAEALELADRIRAMTYRLATR
ncbi:MAG: hypothetical protein IPQ07_01940 [Myxococcales bacterium]|nr:hypothetical protein [Myxococcales bacterium]